MNVCFRPIRYEDLQFICKWWNDKTVMGAVRAEKFSIELETLQKEYWPFWKDPGPQRFHQFIICLDDEPIGEIGFFFTGIGGVAASVDIKIGEPSLWCQGIGTLVTRQFLQYLFEEKNVKRVTAEIGEWNQRSMAMFKKCGFKEISRSKIPPNNYFDGGVGVLTQLTRAKYDYLKENGWQSE